MRHARIAHDLSRGDDRDDRDDGEAQVPSRAAQAAHHAAEAGTLDGTTDEGREQDENTGRCEPGEGVRFTAGAVVDQHAGLDEVQWIMDGRDELRRHEQEDEDEDEWHPGADGRACRDGRFVVMRWQGVFRVIDGEELGTGDDGGHRDDGTADDGELRAHEHGDGKLCGRKADAGRQAHEHHALEAFEAVTCDDDHEKRAEDGERYEL